VALPYTIEQLGAAQSAIYDAILDTRASLSQDDKAARRVAFQRRVQTQVADDNYGAILRGVQDLVRELPGSVPASELARIVSEVETTSGVKLFHFSKRDQRILARVIKRGSIASEEELKIIQSYVEALEADQTDSDELKAAWALIDQYNVR
jgi:hypothetical protein